MEAGHILVTADICHYIWGLRDQGRRWCQESRSQDHHHPWEPVTVGAARGAETKEGLPHRSQNLERNTARDAAQLPASASHWQVGEKLPS